MIQTNVPLKFFCDCSALRLLSSRAVFRVKVSPKRRSQSNWSATKVSKYGTLSPSKVVHHGIFDEFTATDGVMPASSLALINSSWLMMIRCFVIDSDSCLRIV
ncbi:hypothetical protein V3C99_006465 [Haemonchus contortus]